MRRLNRGSGFSEFEVIGKVLYAVGGALLINQARGVRWDGASGVAMAQRSWAQFASPVEMASNYQY